MLQSRQFLVLFLSAAGLTGCGAEQHRAAPQSAIGRTFDQLASMVASCAASLSSCRGDGGDLADNEACQEAFGECRSRAGKEEESALAEAISVCQQRANDCRSDAANDGCTSALRTCIGEATAQTPRGGEDDGGAASTHAPTYPCFAPLRECIADDTAPRECAAKARECVIAAVQPARAARSNTKPPFAGSSASAGRSAAGVGGQAGGAAGANAAGQGGSAGANTGAGRGGAGQGGASDVAHDCAAAHEACLSSGEKPMLCAKAQRKCIKMEDDEQEP